MSGGTGFSSPYFEFKVVKVDPSAMKSTYIETRGVTFDIAVFNDATGRDQRRSRTSVPATKLNGVFTTTRSNTSSRAKPRFPTRCPRCIDVGTRPRPKKDAST